MCTAEQEELKNYRDEEQWFWYKICEEITVTSDGALITCMAIVHFQSGDDSKPLVIPMILKGTKRGIPFIATLCQATWHEAIYDVEVQDDSR